MKLGDRSQDIQGSVSIIISRYIFNTIFVDKTVVIVLQYK